MSESVCDTCRTLPFTNEIAFMTADISCVVVDRQSMCSQVLPADLCGNLRVTLVALHHSQTRLPLRITANIVRVISDCEG
jgi:hypothetical protein